MLSLIDKYFYFVFRTCKPLYNTQPSVNNCSQKKYIKAQAQEFLTEVFESGEPKQRRNLTVPIQISKNKSAKKFLPIK